MKPKEVIKPVIKKVIQKNLTKTLASGIQLTANPLITRYKAQSILIGILSILLSWEVLGKGLG